MMLPDTEINERIVEQDSCHLQGQHMSCEVPPRTRKEQREMPAVRRTRLIEIVWKLHRFVYRASGGRVGGAFGGAPVLLLITTGRRSGEPRSVTLTYFEDGDRLVVVASNTGEDRHPAWWLNLQEHPDAAVQVGATTTRVRAKEAVGEERERL